MANVELLHVLRHAVQRVLHVGMLAQKFAKRQRVHLQEIQKIQIPQTLPLFVQQIQLNVGHIVVCGNVVQMEKYVELCL